MKVELINTTRKESQRDFSLFFRADDSGSNQLSTYWIRFTKDKGPKKCPILGTDFVEFFVIYFYLVIVGIRRKNNQMNKCVF